MNVTLRERQKGNKISLYLDLYENGKRKYEYLKLYLHAKPENGKLTKEQRDHNEKTMALAEAVRSKRLLQFKNEEFGFRDTEKSKGSFLTYFETLTEKRRNSQGNWGNWDSTLKHLKNYAKFDVTFKEVDKHWLEGSKIIYIVMAAENKKDHFPETHNLLITAKWWQQLKKRYGKE